MPRSPWPWILAAEENPKRWVLFPIQYPAVYEMYKKHEASFWTAEEIDLGEDMRDWEVPAIGRIPTASLIINAVSVRHDSRSALRGAWVNGGAISSLIRLCYAVSCKEYLWPRI